MERLTRLAEDKGGGTEKKRKLMGPSLTVKKSVTYGREIRIKLATDFTLETENDVVTSWITEEKVKSARNNYVGLDEKASKKLFDRIVKDDLFLEVAKTVKDQFRNSELLMLELKDVEASVRALYQQKQAEQRLQKVPYTKNNYGAISTRPRVFILPARKLIKKNADFEPIALCADDSQQVFLKSPNHLLCSAGCPEQIEESEEGKDMKLGNCAPNSAVFGLQIVIQEGYAGLFHDMIADLSPGTSLYDMAIALYCNKGHCSLQSEKAKVSAVLDHKEQVEGKRIVRRTSRFKVWMDDYFKVHTFRGNFASCDICGWTINLLTGPNLTRNEFNKLIGLEDLTLEEVMRHCGRCLKKTPHSTTYVIPAFGLYLDLSNEQKSSHYIRDLLRELPKTIDPAGRELQQLVLYVNEVYDVGSHQFCLQWSPDGKTLMELSDHKPGKWNEPFCPDPSIPNPFPLKISGVTYGCRGL